MTVPYAPTPPPPDRRRPRTFLIIFGLLAVLCCCGVAVGGGILFKRVATAAGPARDAADDFVTALESGNASAAYDQLCGETQSQFTRDAFLRGVEGQPKIRSHEIDGVNVSDFNGEMTATVTVSLTMDTGFVDQHKFPLVREGDRWRVCGRPF